jgi:hypothetical protein
VGEILILKVISAQKRYLRMEQQDKTTRHNNKVKQGPLTKQNSKHTKQQG